MLNLDRIIEKAVKKYVSDVKLKKFPKKLIFYMEKTKKKSLSLKKNFFHFYNSK